MRISTVSLFPALYEPFVKTSLPARAVEAGIVSLTVDDLFSLVGPKKRIDSSSFGPGAGMLLKPEVIEMAIEKNEKLYGPAYKIFFSPKGQKLDQNLLKKFVQILQEKKHVMLIPARYEGMDARVEEVYADCLVSLGDYVLMGGDLPAMVLMEGLLRLIPGVVGKEESIRNESFSGPFVDYPEYAAPVVWKGIEVPEIIRSGNHGAIEVWRREKAARDSVVHHFGWVRSHTFTKEDKKLVAQKIPPHYVILMHSQVLLGDDTEGTSSVTSLDIHDIARSACTYGIKKYLLVTPLLDQQRIVKKLLHFWHTDIGIEYNPQRHEALKAVDLVDSFDTALALITKDTGKKPLCIATSARDVENVEPLTYYDQERIWSQERPVVMVFGTARGLAPSVLNRCDYVLGPLEGFSEFNHLSVRSAAAIILDRWLGSNPVAEQSVQSKLDAPA
jgi:tRNA (guanine37-N1)-methyltransferase